eukprot:TRINITY_DN7402_c0_g1_i1.p1 TRINITY_DN7402_c0_g1~~TRINITY_DN7402_c0_g1_i1.p1  ORF type:complete len:1045 (+),score=264.94 TRINITY_DN7402_c0_g1_i1:38-3136(+)
MDPVQQLLQLLQGVVDPSNDIRTQAERQLETYSNQPGYGLALTQITLDEQKPQVLRQVASVVLKKYVKEHWSPDELDDEEEPSAEASEAKQPNTPVFCTSEEEKASIRAVLPNGLRDRESKIRTAVGMTIARIAVTDWPESWPTLVDDLVACLRRYEDVNLVNGAIRCLDVFAEDENLSDEYLPRLINTLFPDLLRIFNDSQNYSEKIRAKSISIIYSLMKWLSVFKTEKKKEVSHFFNEVLPTCLQGFVNALSAPDRADSNCEIKISIMKALIILAGDFPKHMAPFLPRVLAPVWASIANGLPLYEQSCVHSSSQETANADADEEGDVLGFESLITYLLEFVRCVVEKKKFRDILKANLTDLIYVVIGYMQMTFDQEVEWDSNTNQFVSDEDANSTNVSLRTSSATLIDQLLDDMKQVALKALGTAATKRIQESEALKSQGKSNSWKIREATIYAVGSASDQIKENPSVFDINGFINNVLKGDLAAETTPYLRGRALWCGSRFAASVSAESILPFLSAASHSITNAKDPIPVRIGACRAIGDFCPQLPAEVLNPFLPHILSGVTALLVNSSEESLDLILYVLSRAIKPNMDITAQHEKIITTSLLEVWSKNHADMLTSDFVSEILTTLMKIPSIYMQTTEKLLPAIAQILRSPDDIPGLTDSSILILTNLVRNCPADLPLPSVTLEFTFSLVIAKMMNCPESNILQQGIKCLTAFVFKAGDQLVTFKVDGTHTAFQLVIGIIEKLLQPSLNDYSVYNAGYLISAVITKMSTHLGTFLQTLLQAVLQRLETAQLPVLIQSLILVFERLVHTHPTDVINFLSSVQMPQHQTTALNYVIGQWVKWHIDFSGSSNSKLSLVALAKIFHMNDPRLQNIQVPGDPIVEVQGKIVTRSMSKKGEQWTSLPLRAKIFQLMAREYAIIDEQAKYDEEGDGDDDDDDEGEKDFKDYVQGLGQAKFVDADLLYNDESDIEDDDEEEEDPNVADDPIRTIDLKSFIEEFVLNCWNADRNGTTALVQLLLQNDQESLQEIVKKA